MKCELKILKNNIRYDITGIFISGNRVDFILEPEAETAGRHQFESEKQAWWHWYRYKEHHPTDGMKVEIEKAGQPN